MMISAESRFTVYVITSFSSPVESLLKTASLVGATFSMAVIWSPTLSPALYAGEFSMTFVTTYFESRSNPGSSFCSDSMREVRTAAAREGSTYWVNGSNMLSYM